MTLELSIIIPLLALLATFYQLHLQRAHNEKSLKPLGQITLSDHSRIVSVRLYNNGLGPLIVDQIAFSKGKVSYPKVADWLTLAPRSYTYIAMDDLTERVVLPNAYLTIFEKNFDNVGNNEEIENLKLELSSIILRADCRDIYDNKIIVERSFKWFSRYAPIAISE